MIKEVIGDDVVYCEFNVEVEIVGGDYVLYVVVFYVD